MTVAFKSNRGEVVSYGTPLKPADRQLWLLRYFLRGTKQNRVFSVNVLDKDFVDEYLEATNATFKPTNYGANRSRMLGSDLSQLERDRKFRRKKAGIGDGMSALGFPKSVWDYSLRYGPDYVLYADVEPLPYDVF